MAQKRSKFLSRFFYSLFGLALFCGLFYLVFIYLSGSAAEKSLREMIDKDNANFVNYQAGFWADHERLRFDPIFQYGSDRNAGEIFDPHTVDLHMNVVLGGPFEIPKELKDKIANQDEAWLKLDVAEIPSSLDFSWFKRLLDYDHWELNTGEKKSSMRGIAWNQPTADLTTLFAWTKLYLLKSRNERSLIEASVHIRKLAQLLFSNENLVSAIGVAYILDIENQAYKAWTKDGYIISDWKTYPERETERIKRFIMALPEFLQPSLDKEGLQKFDQLKLGKCIAVTEVFLFQNQPMGAVFRDVFSEFYSKLDGIYEDPDFGCRLKYQREFLALERPDSVPLYKKLFLKYTKAKYMFVEVMLGIARPNYFRSYDKPLPQD